MTFYLLVRDLEEAKKVVIINRMGLFIMRYKLHNDFEKLVKDCRCTRSIMLIVLQEVKSGESAK